MQCCLQTFPGLLIQETADFRKLLIKCIRVKESEPPLNELNW